MSEAASTASAPSAAADVSAASTAPVDAGGASPTADTEPAPSPEAALEEHVAHALKAGKRKEAAEKGKATKAARNQFASKPVTSEPEAEPAEAAEPEAEEKPNRAGKSPRQLLDDGDVDGAFLAAFGKKPGDFNINSARWEQHRKVVAREKQALAEREHRYNTLVTKVQDEVRPLLQFRDAAKLYQDGDLEGAIKLAFGDDVSNFNRKLLQNFHGKNPEVDAVRAELRALKEERERERQEIAQQQQAQQLNQQREQYVQSMTSTIADSGDPQLAAFAQKPRFIGRVFQILQQHYDPASDWTLPVLEAADMARQEIVSEFGDVFGGPRDAGAPAVSGRGGSIPAKPLGRPSKTLSQHGAAETSAPPNGWHGKSLDEQVREFERLGGQRD